MEMSRAFPWCDLEEAFCFLDIRILRAGTNPQSPARQAASLTTTPGALDCL